MRHGDATLMTVQERTSPLAGGGLFSCSLDAVQVAGQAAVGTTAMSAFQKAVLLQVCQSPLHRAAGQLQVLRDPADAGPTGIPRVRPILEVHIDCPCSVRQVLVCIDASKVAHGLVSSL